MIRFYYLATVLFLLLDLILDINVRVAFLEDNPLLRASYYAIIFTCMALILWRPAWTVAISAVESAVALGALILSMGIRVMTFSDATLESGAGAVTLSEIINFIIVGSVAYLAYARGMQDLHDKTRIS